MTYRTRRIVINSLMRAQSDILRARTYMTDTSEQTAQELTVDLNNLVAGLEEIILTLRTEP